MSNKINTKTMPRDTDGDMGRAASLLAHIRKEMTSDKRDVPRDWQAWIAQQVAGDYATEETAPEA